MLLTLLMTRSSSCCFGFVFEFENGTKIGEEKNTLNSSNKQNSDEPQKLTEQISLF